MLTIYFGIWIALLLNIYLQIFADGIDGWEMLFVFQASVITFWMARYTIHGPTGYKRLPPIYELHTAEQELARKR